MWEQVGLGASWDGTASQVHALQRGGPPQGGRARGGRAGGSTISGTSERGQNEVLGQQAWFLVPVGLVWGGGHDFMH